MPSGAELDLESAIDRLYALPLAEFVGARNELAKRLRAAGDRPEAERVKGLAKPSVTAWAVNALYHHERRQFDALLEAAAALRAALAGRGDRRQAEAERRQALKTLVTAAAGHLTAAGHAATPPSRQRISHTLEALAARDPAQQEPRAGRLASDLEPRGFDVLAGLAASLPPSGRRAAAKRAAREPARQRARQAPKPDPRIEAARLEVDESKEDLGRLEGEAERAETAASEAIERHRRLAEDAAEAERRARELATAAATAKRQMAAAKAAATKATSGRRRARSRVETAKRRLARLESRGTG